MTIGRIYKIVDYTTNKIYVGSTTTSIRKRLSKHKYCYKKYLEGNENYYSSYEILKNENYDIVLLEQIEFNDANELCDRERYYINLYNDIVVNVRLPYGLKKKDYGKIYRENNKTKIINSTKTYRETNRDKINEKQIENVLCFCGSTYTKCNKNRHEDSQKHHTNFMINMKKFIDENKKIK